MKLKIKHYLSPTLSVGCNACKTNNVQHSYWLKNLFCLLIARYIISFLLLPKIINVKVCFQSHPQGFQNKLKRAVVYCILKDLCRIFFFTLKSLKNVISRILPCEYLESCLIALFSKKKCETSVKE